MAYELRDMSGTLFPEREKRSENGPDYTGTVMVRGERLRIAAWQKQGKGDRVFLSLAFSEPRDGGGRADDDSSVPF